MQAAKQPIAGSRTVQVHLLVNPGRKEQISKYCTIRACKGEICLTGNVWQVSAVLIHLASNHRNSNNRRYDRAARPISNSQMKIVL